MKVLCERVDCVWNFHGGCDCDEITISDLGNCDDYEKYEGEDTDGIVAINKIAANVEQMNRLLEGENN